MCVWLAARSSALRPPQRPASPPASLQQELGACHAELAALRLHLDMMAQRLAARAGRAVPVRLEVLQVRRAQGLGERVCLEGKFLGRAGPA